MLFFTHTQKKSLLIQNYCNKIRKVIFCIFFCCGYLTAASQSKINTVFIPFNSPDLYYEGRILKTNDAAILSWSGSSVTVLLKGTNLSVILKDADTSNYYNVIIDDKKIFKIHTDTTKKTYVLASGLTDAKHTIQLFKRTEWANGKTWLYGFETSNDTKILHAHPPSKRKIEFYGNSITCGSAIIEDSKGNNSGNGCFQNNYLSYVAITARHFKAQYSCIARSGIGIMVSWNRLIMPEMYDRLDATDSTSKWNFKKYIPDVVVVNLFQNDSYLITDTGNAQFKYRFGKKAPDKSFIIDSYKLFIKKLWEKYSNAYIICVLGNMDATRESSPWPGYIQCAVEQMNDPKIFTHFFQFKKNIRTPKHSRTTNNGRKPYSIY